MGTRGQSIEMQAMPLQQAAAIHRLGAPKVGAGGVYTHCLRCGQRIYLRTFQGSAVTTSVPDGLAQAPGACVIPVGSWLGHTAASLVYWIVAATAIAGLVRIFLWVWRGPWW